MPGKLMKKLAPTLKQASEILKKHAEILEATDTLLTKQASEPTYFLDLQELRELSDAN